MARAAEKSGRDLGRAVARPTGSRGLDVADLSQNGLSADDMDDPVGAGARLLDWQKAA
jgi:hypothetical protein